MWLFDEIMIEFLIAMWPDLGESVGGRTCDIFCFLFNWSPHEGRCFLVKTPPESDQWFQSYTNWKILKTIENKRNSFLFLAVSHNQCSRLPTDPARSQHIFVKRVLMWGCQIWKPCICSQACDYKNWLERVGALLCTRHSVIMCDTKINSAKLTPWFWSSWEYHWFCIDIRVNLYMGVSVKL